MMCRCHARTTETTAYPAIRYCTAYGALAFFSVYIPVGSGFSAESWESWRYDVMQNAKGALLGNEMSVVSGDIDTYIKNNCSCSSE